MRLHSFQVYASCSIYSAKIQKFKSTNDDKYSKTSLWPNSNKLAINDKSSDIRPSPRSRLNPVDEDSLGTKPKQNFRTVSITVCNS